MSLNPEIDGDIPALIGASAALALSGMPFQGPIGAAKVGYKNGQYMLNPDRHGAEGLGARARRRRYLERRADGRVRSQAAVRRRDARRRDVRPSQMQKVINAINELAPKRASPSWTWQPPAKNDAADRRARREAERTLLGRPTRSATSCSAATRSPTIKKDVLPSLAGRAAPQLERRRCRQGIRRSSSTASCAGRCSTGKPRIDGRDLNTVRPITIRIGVLPRTHGSSLFTRGETQAIVVTTLGTARDAQIIDALGGEHKEQFLFHYNFPPFSVGETGMMGPEASRNRPRPPRHARRARRDAGHGRVPVHDPRRLGNHRVERLGSMASVCGSSLALMDAGVPIKAPVAGIAMGLVKEGDHFAC